eukprot:TRINITY_DN14667_c0_g1_i1.p1 TRINITY_DN14667_c0_g1~~TRINITY_DN14667_c0_g1_i1.p1  ORF type:complete len:229 (-),score=62.03 TRINITY_DN14667_c0_g1_i1:5-598(-)
MVETWRRHKKPSESDGEIGLEDQMKSGRLEKQKKRRKRKNKGKESKRKKSKKRERSVSDSGSDDYSNSESQSFLENGSSRTSLVSGRWSSDSGRQHTITHENGSRRPSSRGRLEASSDEGANDAHEDFEGWRIQVGTSSAMEFVPKVEIVNYLADVTLQQWLLWDDEQRQQSILMSDDDGGHRNCLGHEDEQRTWRR